MKLGGQIATILLAEEGKKVLSLAGIVPSESNSLLVVIEEPEELGLWLRLQGLPEEDQVHFFLLRWEFILGIDIASGLGKTTGLKG